MNRIECPGLDGSNPLHFLASLGVLRVFDRNGHSPKLCWQFREGHWQPLILFDALVNDPPAILASSLEELAKVNTSTEKNFAGPTQKEIKTLEDKLNSVKKHLREEGKTKGLKGSQLDAYISVDPEGSELLTKLLSLRNEKEAALSSAANQMGIGIAHLGDKVGSPAKSVRAKFDEALQSWTAGPHNLLHTRSSRFIVDHLASLCSDAVERDGMVIPTPYSYSNGQGGQFLLKNFRDCAQSAAATEVMRKWLLGESVPLFDVTSLNWDPQDRNDYALTWANPGNSQNKKQIDAVTNALAFIGLGLLTVVPKAIKGLSAICWDYSETKGFLWPIWSDPLSVDAIQGLLFQTSRNKIEELRSRGVESVFFSEKLDIGEPPMTRFYFAPSRSL